MQTVAYRFDANIDNCFRDVITMFGKSSNLIDYLTDTGSHKVSRKYLAAWERGFRLAALTGYVITCTISQIPPNRLMGRYYCIITHHDIIVS